MYKEYIKAFLDYNKRPIDKDVIAGAMILNMIFFYIGTYLSNNKMTSFLICTIINIGMLGVFIYFHKTVKHDYKNILLYYGIYFWEFSISCNYLAYQLLIKVWGNSMLLFLMMFSGIIIVNLYTYLYVNYKVKKGKYLKKAETSENIIQIVVPLSVGLSSIVIYMTRDNLTTIDYYHIFGFILWMFGLLMASGIQVIIKYHYYNVYESFKE